MDPAIFSVAISYLIFGTLVGMASTVFLIQPTIRDLHQLKEENLELKQDIEELEKEANAMRAVKHLLDGLYDADDEHEEEVVPTLPPPPPAIRCSYRYQSCEIQTPIIGST